MEFDEIPFWSISNLIFTACVACKIQVLNRPKMVFVDVHFLKSIFQKSSADQQGDLHKSECSFQVPYTIWLGYTLFTSAPFSLLTKGLLLQLVLTDFATSEFFHQIRCTTLMGFLTREKCLINMTP